MGITEECHTIKDLLDGYRVLSIKVSDLDREHRRLTLDYMLEAKNESVMNMRIILPLSFLWNAKLVEDITAPDSFFHTEGHEDYYVEIPNWNIKIEPPTYIKVRPASPLEITEEELERRFGRPLKIIPKKGSTEKNGK